MNLSQDILYYRLARQFPARFPLRRPSTPPAGRPVFFRAEPVDGHPVLLLSAGQLAALGAQAMPPDRLFICYEPVEQAPAGLHSSLITFEQAVDKLELLNALQGIFGHMEQWESGLMRVCYEEGRYQELIDLTVPVVYDPLCILDAEFHHVAYCENSVKQGLVDAYVDDNDRITPEIFDQILAEPEFPKTYELQEPFTSAMPLPAVVQNILYMNRYQGRIILRCELRNEALVNYNLAVLRILSQYVHMLFGKYKTFNPADNIQNSLIQLLGDCFSGKPISPEQWEKTIAECGWATGDRMQVIQFRPNPLYDKNVYPEYMSKVITRDWDGCVCLEYQEALLLLVNLDRFAAPTTHDFLQALPYFLRDKLLVAGLSRVIRSFRHIYPAYRQSGIALKLGLAKAPTFWYHRFDSFALDYLLSRCTEQLPPELLCSEKLLRVRQHDRDRGTHYYNTLRTYFRCSFNAVAAAKQLFIHRSTFINRMERMREIASIDYESSDELLYIGLSLKILEEQRETGTQYA